MGRVSVALRARRQPKRAQVVAAACHAPFGNLFLNAVGEVHTCCVSRGHPLGNIAEQRLPEIWHGAPTAAVRQALVDDDYSLGCGVCERHIASGMPTLQAGYDYLATATMTPRYPRALEINISNSCNLQCVMCDGDYSTSIRIHRERRPPLPKVYDEQFFEDLAEFLPHLESVSFTGGEPFLVPEYPRIWEALAACNPDVRATVTTNGTQWNDRVEHALGLLRFNVFVSLDGGRKASFERCRVGADWEVVRANLDRFVDYTRRVGTTLTIYHCLMAQNHEDFGELLLLADALDVDVIVHLVEDPPECSLELSSDPLLHGAEGVRRWDAVRASFQQQADEVRPRLGRNAAVFEAQYRRIMTGALLTPILGLPWSGQPGFDEAHLADELNCDLEQLSQMRAVLGPDHRVAEVSPALASIAEVRADQLVGQPLETFGQALVDALGPRGAMVVTASTDDFFCQEVTYGPVRFRNIVMAARDTTGWLSEVRLYAERLA